KAVVDKIRFMDYLGDSGNTGNSTGAHLHFAIREDGNYVDPISFKEVLDSISGRIYVPGEYGNLQMANDIITESQESGTIFTAMDDFFTFISVVREKGLFHAIY